MAEQPHSGSLTSRTAIVTVFENFRDELDEHNDRRERLIKVGENGVALHCLKLLLRGCGFRFLVIA